MNKEYNFNWDDNVSCENGDTLQADTLNRAIYAKLLTQFLLTKSAPGYVLNLNSGWGTGKTYFLKRWQHSIQDHHPTVYIDAWKQDFSDDPLMAIVSSIITQLAEQSQDEFEKGVRYIGSKAWGFFKQAAPEITKAVIKKASGIDVEQIVDNSETEDILGSKEFGDAAGKIVAAMLNEHAQKLKSIDEFKSAIKSFIKDTISCTNKNNPTFIFIDELDRCRPSYAVEMLEVIKHFFSMNNVIFVIATDTEQLQHAVKVVYGNDFNANIYLGRFFQRRCTLREQPRIEFIKTQISTVAGESLSDFFPKIWPSVNGDTSYFCEIIASIADIYNLPLRDTEQLIDKVLAVLTTLHENEKVDLLLLCSLMVIHDRYYDYYQQIIKNKLNGSGNSYYDSNIIYKTLESANIDIEVNINLKPEKIFPYGTITEDHIRYHIGIKSGSQKLRYSAILAFQLRAIHDKNTVLTQQNSAACRTAKERGQIEPLAMAGIEISSLEDHKAKYKDWIELAASFE